MIKCTSCDKQAHVDCQEANRNMFKSNIDKVNKYVCHQCQFMQMDPLAVPIATLLRPFKIVKLKQNQVKSRGNKSIRDFTVKEHYYEAINKGYNFEDHKGLRIQVRCIRLNQIGFEHCWPKFGCSIINKKISTEYKMPDPPND